MKRLIALMALAVCIWAQDGREEGRSGAGAFNGLRLRLIGPAVTGGRVVGFAVNPFNKAEYFAAVASGGVWKTVNAGASWTPVFDREGSYSIGAVVADPKNPHTVWVGTGEGNSQRSVGYGDGVYRSDDGGKSWRNVGLKASEHIGRIAVDPRDSNVVVVAAQGPLWSSGGERGLYKTADGGKTWAKILDTGENTGVTDVVIDPFNPDVLLAASWQRRRHTWTLINGGPDTAIHKSTDAGKSWRKVTSGLPNEEMGRIGLAFSPAKRGLVYARIEAANKAGGIFRSVDGGETWEKRNPFDDLGLYYGQIIADPKDADRIFVANTIARVSDDGGRTLRPLGDRAKHVDTHTVWVDPDNTEHLLAGCDGGIYETWEGGRVWQFKANLPIAQFYDVTADNSVPNYWVCGGTQDNATVCGPSRTRNAGGIANHDWFVSSGGDGFHARVDPDDPNTIYSESQYGVLVRYDRRTGERIGIKPVEAKGEPPLRWNWDAPLAISPHSSKRLYFAANKLFRSDDRGESWRAVSGELTRAVDRNKLPVMGRVWGPDAVAKSNSTAFYSNISVVAESPRREGLLYVGTDDGLIQVSESGGQSWRKIEAFPGVPENTYVARILPSQHDESTVYAAFDNHKMGDFKPYLLKSTDKGATWTAIQSDLPARGSVLAIAEDHVNPQLIFAGTEFGLFFTMEGGKRWTPLRGGLPKIAVRDLAIQKRENDLVVGTFGRGIYILDDYTPLRALKPDTLNQDVTMFPVKNATAYMEARPLGGRGRGSQGESYFAAENPPVGAVFTYHLKDALQSARQKRQQAQKDADRKGGQVAYPSLEDLSKEAEDEAPAMVLTVTDARGAVVRRLTGQTARGFHRVAWNLRLPAPVLGGAPRRGGEGDEETGFNEPPSGGFVPPGRYAVALSKRVNGVTTPVGQPQSFDVAAESAGLAALVSFQQKLGRLEQSSAGAADVANGFKQKLTAILQAVQESAAPLKLREDASAMEKRVNQIQRALRGDEALRQRQENQAPSIRERVNSIRAELNLTTNGPTKTHEASYEVAREGLAAEIKKLRAMEAELRKLEQQLDAAGVPPTPGRIPEVK